LVSPANSHSNCSTFSNRLTNIIIVIAITATIVPVGGSGEAAAGASPIFGKRIDAVKRKEMYQILIAEIKKKYLKILFFYFECPGVISKNNPKRLKRTVTHTATI
jgi:hypothetical protein